MARAIDTASKIRPIDPAILPIFIAEAVVSPTRPSHALVREVIEQPRGIFETLSGTVRQRSRTQIDVKPAIRCVLGCKEQHSINSVNA
jgi:hypothetical protein